MNLNIQTPKKSLNKAFLKIKPTRDDIDNLKANLRDLLDRTNETESEEFHKNLVSDFLKKTGYEQNHFINTKGRNDLVIHNGKDAKSTVGVIIEAKRPANKAEMLSQDNINVKAFQELVLYFLRERITQKNSEIRYLIATNVYEWFIFDAAFFEKTFAEDKNLVRKFNDFEAGRLSARKTDFFYEEIARPAIDKILPEATFTWFDLREYKNLLKDEDKEKKLIPLFKIFSPEHLLKLPFANDSNTLDKSFYSELLHIIGLTETRQGGKKIIERKKDGERNAGSLLENAIIQIDGMDKINRIEHPEHFGENLQERLFNVGLELSITWINRILFLKLLEAQLISYHNSDREHSFLDSAKIRNFSDLNSLFFQVLARKPEERNGDIKQAFAKVPYLNSSLFEPTELEHNTLFISNLDAEKKLPLIASTVLKDDKGKKRTGEMNTLEYLFAFLDAYDFASESSDILKEKKSLINASVLGLIFEKINGYKDGSFFTPGFITMYMCRETLRRAVLQKFNERKGWKCESLDDLYDRIDDRTEANEIINSLKICDPAVGSGHFLVSALNEILAIKSELRILQDREGKRLKEYQVEVESDELVITDEDGEIFEYKPESKESRRVQETLFHEKQTIIENCLFGVDINPNSVKICRLRLWIELLKNAFYNDDNQLETLPNIDINIKCGNSLVSRFALDVNIKKLLKKNKWNIDTYKKAVQTYRNARNKDEKREMNSLIADIKSDLRTEIGANDPKIKRLKKLSGDLNILLKQKMLFEETAKDKKIRENKQKNLEKEISKTTAELEDIKNNRIYENAFEWRFEFPEVLNDNGDFIGFDVVIGNPPYGRYLGMDNNIKNHLKNRKIYGATGDVAEFFIKLVSGGLLNNKFTFSFIIPKGLSYVNSWSDIRSLLVNKIFINQAIDTSRSFDEAAYEMMIVMLTNSKQSYIKAGSLSENTFTYDLIPFELYKKGIFFFGIPQGTLNIANKITSTCHFVSDYYDCWYGKGGITPKINKQGQGIKLLTGKEVQKFHIKNIENEWFLDLAELSEVDLKRANIKKVVVQDIVAHIKNPNPHIKLTGTIDYEGSFCLNTIMCFSQRSEYSNEFLLGIINSKFMSFYFYYFIFNQAIRTMHFMPGYSDKLPIPDKIIYHDEITSKIFQILTAKKQDPKADTSVLENKIDQMVYELYGLTEEEIAIVEQETRS